MSSGGFVARSSESPPLSVQNLTFQYRTREQPAIEDLTFTLHAGELLFVAGSSGCDSLDVIRGVYR